MRALNSRRPQSASIYRLVSRTTLCFLVLFCALYGARARSVPRNDDFAADQVHGKISESPAEVSDSGTPDDAEEATKNVDRDERRKSLKEKVYIGHGQDISDGRRKPTEGVIIEQPGKIQVDATGSEEGSVAKKRRRNDVTLPGKSVLQDGGSVARDAIEENAPKEEGIRRFDAQVESDDAAEEELGQRKALLDDITDDIPDSQKDAVEYQRRLIDVKRAQSDVTKNVAANPNDEDGTGQEGTNYGEISTDYLGEKVKNIESTGQAERIDSSEKEIELVKNLAEGSNSEEAQIEKSDGVNGEIRNDLRSFESNDGSEGEKNEEKSVVGDETSNKEEVDVKNVDPNREHRHLSASDKSKHKSSTVYLNAEEGNLPGRDQESIVDGQIKKLISIRNDALESVGDSGKNLDEKGPLPEKSEAEADVLAVEKNEEVRNQRSSDAKDASTQSESIDQSSSPTETTETTGLNRIQKWKYQAALLQEQIKNKTFLQYLREQTTEVLPDIPKFTEIQLLETLKNIALSRKSSSNETYSADLNATALSENQLQIIKCAEQLITTKERQTFVTNMGECIRGLSVLNCMRIFVWPVVLENVPESVSQSLSNLPIEINLIDLFQGIRAKTARSRNNVHAYHPRLLTPESVVFNILKNALDSKATYDQAPIFISPKNETLRRLLTSGQLQILQMAEKLLPGEIRREYSDRMFSCVRRFEYFSCIKYFAWPMVKQYHPTLPSFPDYQAWYPSVALYPQYPIVPFPSFLENTGELPEVVEADATRIKKPKPEAIIVNILQNTLKEHAKVPPPSIAHSADPHFAILPPEQLLSIHMAGQLLPISYRPEFLQKTVKCIQEYNYVTCIKYSTWPTVKQFSPTLPDLSNWIPDLSFPNVFGYFPDLPSFPDFSSFIPSFISGGESNEPSDSSNPDDSSNVQKFSGQLPAIFRQNEISSKRSGDLENKITEILTRVRNSLKTIPENSPLILTGNAIILTTMTEKQLHILRLAESILPPPARAPFVNQVLSCLQANKDFLNCTRYVIWPTVALYVPNFPEFPNLPPNTQQPPRRENQQASMKDKNVSQQNTKEQREWDKSQTATNSNVKIISRTKFPQSNNPVISVTGTRFVPIFTEHPESVILNILKSVQLSSPNVHGDPITKIANTHQFSDLLSDQQESIIRITEGLLPDAARASFVNRMVACVRKSNFLPCSRDVLWPTLSEYFPRLTSFPNFGRYPYAISSKLSLPQNLTDTSPFSETDVKIGQHGDATVTITDTRFYPVFTEHPEGVILNILRAVQHATPGVLNSVATAKSPEMTTYFTEQQSNIVQIAESLLPESIRSVFVERMVTCARESTFLECTRDIAWPTIAQFFPRLPNFPNFGSYQSLPRTTKLDLSSILFRNAYSEEQTPSEKVQNTPKTAVDTIEDKIENLLKELLSKDSTRSEDSYLNVDNIGIGTFFSLTSRQVDIIRLTEKAIPDTLRRAYLTNMLECVRRNTFITCTRHVSWPTLKQFSPTLPNFDQLLGQFPGTGQIPDFVGQIPSFPAAGNYPFAELPGISQFPSQITAIPGGIQSGISQFPGISEFPSFGFPQYGFLSDNPQESKLQEQTKISHSDQTNQISGVSMAANTPSVDAREAVPGYLGQPPSILLDISKEKIHLSDIEQQREPSPESIPSDSSSKKHDRRRRSTESLVNFYYETDGEVERASQTMNDMFPNITESEFLQLLVNISKSKEASEKISAEKPTEYIVDTLNSTIRDSLTADQYEILKIVENLNHRAVNRGIMSQILQCISSLSFIRCMGIFVWPVITNTVPSLIGLPSLPSLPSIPGLGLFGRSTESEVENFFGMSTVNFEKEMLTRKESVENILLNWYKKLTEDKFQTNVGFLKVKGYGNGEIGISFNGFREGRATKLKDNKNLPSILTIISDIMEEVLDQRPDSEKLKREKEKRERSLNDMQEADFQFLKENDEYTDIKRSMNDDQIITMFLDKIKANATDFADGDVTQFLNMEEAHNAFGVLFGTRLNNKFADRLKAFTEEHLRSLHKKNSEPSEGETKESNVEELKTVSLKSHEKESAESEEKRKREHRAKSEFRSFIDKYSDKSMMNLPTENKIDDPESDNKIKDTESLASKNAHSELRIQLPRLQEDFMSKKITSAVIHLGRELKTKLSDMMPGIGFIISFFIQIALAHARAAASMAGMISNMALASAVFGMLRHNLFGPENQKIKYVYDNDKTGPGITWPQHYTSYPHSK